MEYRIIFALTALFCQVKSQLCVTPGAVPAPQVITTPVVATTIVDNSVSNALANALQLLIVSDIIETKLGASCLSNLFNLNPLETPCYGNRIEVIQPIAEYVTPIAPCASPVEIISPCRSVIEPYPYLGCNEIISPNFGFAPNCNPCGTEIVSPCLPNVCLQDIVTPNRNFYNVAEFLTPNFNSYGCGVDIIAPACGTEIVNIPSYSNGCYRGYNELVIPIPYNSCGDIITPCGVEVNSPCGQYYGGISEVITPVSPCNSGCYDNVPEFVTPCNPFGGIREFISSFNPRCGVPEIVTPCRQYCGGFPEVISPIYKPGCSGISELLPINPFGPCSNFPEVIIPNSCNTGFSGCDFCGPTFAPNLYGVQEIVNPVGSCAPIVAEVLIPPAIPAQLNCNFGYSPTLGPCVNFNVEPLPFGPGFCY